MNTKPRVRVNTNGQVRVSDGLVNVAAQLGTSRDKSAHTNYIYMPMAHWVAMNAYRVSWLAKKIVDIPADDSTRRWRVWQSKTGVTTAIESVEKAHRVQKKVLEALTLQRLFGGAGIYFAVRNQDPSTPLNLDAVRSGDLMGVTTLSRYHLAPGIINNDPDDQFWGTPKDFQITGVGGSAVNIHPSRIAIFRGEATASAGIDWTWGDGILQSTLETIKQHDGVAANVASLVFEANVDVLYIPRLMELMRQPNGDAEVVKYLKTVASIKGNNGMVVLDGGDTSKPEGSSGGVRYERKPFTFTGLADVWDRFMQVCSAASDIPATRLFGRAPQGMNSTGEGDLENYHENIASRQTNDIDPAIDLLNEVIIRAATGGRDDSIHYNWRPLREQSETQRTTNGKTTADIIKTLSDANLFPTETLQAAAVTALTETGALPGLEAAVEEHGLELEEDDPDATEEAQKAALRREGIPRLRVVDAAPKTLYVSRKVLNADALIRWAKGEGFEGIEPAEELHVTLAYSRTPVNWMEVGQSWEEEMTIGAGGPRDLDLLGPQADYLALLIPKGSLGWRHEEIKNAGAKWDWDDYQPHITIARTKTIPEGAKPYTGKIILGPEIFEEIKDD